LEWDWTDTEKSTMLVLLKFMTGCSTFFINVDGPEKVVRDCLPLITSRAFNQVQANSFLAKNQV
jgi:hypothetical protein